jgi:hypothetical protein
VQQRSIGLPGHSTIILTTNNKQLTYRTYP